MEVEMKISGLIPDPMTNMPIVVLKDQASGVVLPIWVGAFEANAIMMEIEKVTAPRPMTHDLLKNLLVGLEATVRKVVVTELHPPQLTEICPPGTADVVLTFRNVHNWLASGDQQAQFNAFFKALKPGGILGIFIARRRSTSRLVLFAVRILRFSP